MYLSTTKQILPKKESLSENLGKIPINTSTLSLSKLDFLNQSRQVGMSETPQSLTQCHTCVEFLGLIIAKQTMLMIEQVIPLFENQGKYVLELVEKGRNGDLLPILHIFEQIRSNLNILNQLLRKKDSQELPLVVRLLNKGLTSQVSAIALVSGDCLLRVMQEIKNPLQKNYLWESYSYIYIASPNCMEDFSVSVLSTIGSAMIALNC